MNKKASAFLFLSAIMLPCASMAGTTSSQEVIDEIMLHVYEKCYQESARIKIEESGLDEMGITVDDLVSMMKNLNAEALRQAAEEAASIVVGIETLEQRMQFYDIAKKGCISHQTQ